MTTTKTTATEEISATTAEEVVVRHIGSSFVGQLQFWFACFFVVGWAGVVCGGLRVQFGSWDYPCPLCMVQRMFMLLAALGAGYIVRQGMTGVIEVRDYMMGWGMAVIACMAGGFAAWRQTMLHINDHGPTVGYGAPVLGLHLYVWAWILFMLAIVAIGILQAFAHVTSDQAMPSQPHRTIGAVVLSFVGLVIVVNLVAIFFLEGFHWFLPDNPSQYRFFYDVGLIK